VPPAEASDASTSTTSGRPLPFVSAFGRVVFCTPVAGLTSRVEALESKGIEILGRQDEDYGRFAWIMDPDGVKIELWQQLGPAPE